MFNTDLRARFATLDDELPSHRARAGLTSHAYRVLKSTSTSIGGRPSQAIALPHSTANSSPESPRTSAQSNGSTRPPTPSVAPNNAGHATGTEKLNLTQRFWFALLLAVLACTIVQALVAPTWVQLPAPLRMLADAALLLAVAAAPLWFLLCVPIQRERQAAREEMDRETASLQERLRTHDLNVRLAAALDIAEDEDAVMRIAHQALNVAADGAPAQMLLADSPEAPMRHSLHDGWQSEEGRCFIERPSHCPVVRRGMGTVFEDSLILSACSGLRGPISNNCAAACTPVTVSGSGVGIVRALGPAGDPGLYRLLQSLNTAAHHVGARLAVVRSISASAREAATDPLTGAANRRSGEARLAELAQQPDGFVLAMIDIDHFKEINDSHGHDVGDRALKVLVGVIRDGIRRDDMLCRYGGEEFLLILPTLDTSRVVALLQRCRTELARACTRASVPVFTISAGVADAPNANPALQMRNADAALYRAKEAGRDRVVCAAETDAEGMAAS